MKTQERVALAYDLQATATELAQHMSVFIECTNCVAETYDDWDSQVRDVSGLLAHLRREIEAVRGEYHA
jgi:hypothetical protein